MNNTTKNALIAELVGTHTVRYDMEAWNSMCEKEKVTIIMDKNGRTYTDWDRGMSCSDMKFIHVPDYCNDLNDMHEAEMSLKDTPPAPGEKSDRARYREILCIVALMAGGPIHSTASQRAEAFLKTIKKWEV
jgi:hypothetical protein